MLRQAPSPFLGEITESKFIDLFNEKGPYYTSYPTLGLWSDEYRAKNYREGLKNLFRMEGEDVPLAIYVHIPYCAKLCWYCICNLKITNNRKKIQKFTDYLLREIDMLRALFEKMSISPNIKEIHLGGGTPSHLDDAQFSQLVDGINKLVDINNLSEFAMEIDPRTTSKENLELFKEKGVSRISFGVQDFSAVVQKAINRVQPFEMVRDLLSPEIRKLFTGINFDLLYGLPKQTQDTFTRTLELVNELSPERVTLLKYAHVPEVRRHMKMISESDLPHINILPSIFCHSVEYFIENGYEWIGIDNFAKKTDSLAEAASQKAIGRDFNGWNTGKAKHLIGLGPSSTSAFGSDYAQSVYGTEEYFQAIENDEFPILRGYRMTSDDLVRRGVVFDLICNQSLDFSRIGERYNLDFKQYFHDELEDLKRKFLTSGFIEYTTDELKITYRGRFFLRNIAKTFDKYWRLKDYEITGP